MTASPLAGETSSAVAAPVFRVRRHGDLPVMAVRLALPGGSSLEERAGSAWVSGQMLAEGTTRRNWRRLARELEERGVALSTGAGLESSGLAIDCLVDDWRWALEIAGELVLESAFPEDRCDWVRRQAAAELESLRDQPEVRTAWAFMEELYAGHPAARPIQGRPGDVERVDVDDCVSHHRQALARGPLVVVSGGIDEDRVARCLERLFGRGGEPRWELPWPPAPRSAAVCRRVDLESVDQDHLYAGLLTVSRRHPDFAALELLGVVLGSGPGFGGRLSQRLRERSGLTYALEVATVAGAGFAPGRLTVYCAPSPERSSDAEAAIREELARLPESLEEEDLKRARSYLMGREPLLRETARQWTDLLAEAAFYGEPYEDLRFIEERCLAVDLERLREVSRNYLDPERLIVVRGTGSGVKATRDAPRSATG